MILQALTRCYEDLLQRGEIAAPGWSPAKISFARCLDADGRLTQVIPRRSLIPAADKKNLLARVLRIKLIPSGHSNIWVLR